MERLLRHALVASTAVHVAAVAALQPVEREVPSLPAIEARLLAAALLPQPTVPVVVAAAAPLPKAVSQRSKPVLATAAPSSHSAPPAEIRPAEVAVSVAAVPVAAVVAADPVVTLASPRYDAAYLANPPPPYPASARRRGAEGTSTVEARVGPGGEAREVKLSVSAGDAALDQAALEAVRGWRFIPARRGDQTVEAWVRIPLVFRLD